MSLVEAALLFAAAFGAGIMNSIAGGGTFLTLPTLIFTGIPPRVANATSTVALLPGSFASALGYLPELKGQKLLLPLVGISFVGSVIGAVLLLVTPEHTFQILIPWLMLTATSLFAAGPSLTRRMRKGAAAMREHGRLTAATAAAQFVIAVYGGYFGAGIGILMLAALALSGMEDLHLMNGLKNGLATAINSVAVVTFLASDVSFRLGMAPSWITEPMIRWPQAVLMIAASISGGFAGVKLARVLPTRVTRAVIITIGTVLTTWFFYKTYA